MSFIDCEYLFHCNIVSAFSPLFSWTNGWNRRYSQKKGCTQLLWSTHFLNWVAIERALFFSGWYIEWVYNSFLSWKAGYSDRCQERHFWQFINRQRQMNFTNIVNFCTDDPDIKFGFAFLKFRNKQNRIFSQATCYWCVRCNIFSTK